VTIDRAAHGKNPASGKTRAVLASVVVLLALYATQIAIGRVLDGRERADALTALRQLESRIARFSAAEREWMQAPIESGAATTGPAHPQPARPASRGTRPSRMVSLAELAAEQQPVTTRDSSAYVDSQSLQLARAAHARGEFTLGGPFPAERSGTEFVFALPISNPDANEDVEKSGPSIASRHCGGARTPPNPICVACSATGEVDFSSVAFRNS